MKHLLAGKSLIMMLFKIKGKIIFQNLLDLFLKFQLKLRAV